MLFTEDAHNLLLFYDNTAFLNLAITVRLLDHSERKTQVFRQE